MPVEVVNLLLTILQVLSLLIIGRALLSWFDPGLNSTVGQLLYNVTEPIIGPLRQIIPTIGMIDISPIVALILIQVIGQLLRSTV